MWAAVAREGQILSYLGSNVAGKEARERTVPGSVAERTKGRQQRVQFELTKATERLPR